MTIDWDTILPEFEDYLKNLNIYSVGTCKCYAQDYVKPAVNELLEGGFDSIGFGNPFASYNQSASGSVQRSYIFAISECLIAQEIQNRSLGKSPKTMQNWRSGLRAFFAFLENEGYYFDLKLNNTQLRSKLQGLGGCITYSQKDLQKVFMSRLVTQDRAYAHMIYPARVLNLIFNNTPKKKDYQETLENAIKEIKFCSLDKTSKSETYIPLEKITKLKIDYTKSGKAGNVSFCASGKWYTLLTEDSKTPTEDSKTPTWKPLLAKGLDDLSLDHDVPLSKILDNDEAKKDYPKMSKLSDEYETSANGGTTPSCQIQNYLDLKGIRNFTKNTPVCFARIENTKTQWAIELLHDFKKLYGEIKFTIMLKADNSSKGKK